MGVRCVERVQSEEPGRLRGGDQAERSWETTRRSRKKLEDYGKKPKSKERAIYVERGPSRASFGLGRLRTTAGRSRKTTGRSWKNLREKLEDEAGRLREEAGRVQEAAKLREEAREQRLRFTLKRPKLRVVWTREATENDGKKTQNYGEIAPKDVQNACRKGTCRKATGRSWKTTGRSWKTEWEKYGKKPEDYTGKSEDYWKKLEDYR